MYTVVTPGQASLAIIDRVALDCQASSTCHTLYNPPTTSHSGLMVVPWPPCGRVGWLPAGGPKDPVLRRETRRRTRTEWHFGGRRGLGKMGSEGELLRVADWTGMRSMESGAMKPGSRVDGNIELAACWRRGRVIGSPNVTPNQRGFGAGEVAPHPHPLHTACRLAGCCRPLNLGVAFTTQISHHNPHRPTTKPHPRQCALIPRLSFAWMSKRQCVQSAEAVGSRRRTQHTGNVARRIPAKDDVEKSKARLQDRTRGAVSRTPRRARQWSPGMAWRRSPRKLFERAELAEVPVLTSTLIAVGQRAGNSQDDHRDPTSAQSSQSHPQTTNPAANGNLGGLKTALRLRHRQTRSTFTVHVLRGTCPCHVKLTLSVQERIDRVPTPLWEKPKWKPWRRS